MSAHDIRAHNLPTLATPAEILEFLDKLASSLGTYVANVHEPPVKPHNPNHASTTVFFRLANVGLHRQFVERYNANRPRLVGVANGKSYQEKINFSFSAKPCDVHDQTVGIKRPNEANPGLHKEPAVVRNDDRTHTVINSRHLCSASYASASNRPKASHFQQASHKSSPESNVLFLWDEATGRLLPPGHYPLDNVATAAAN